MDMFIAYFKDPRIFLKTSKKNENLCLGQSIFGMQFYYVSLFMSLQIIHCSTSG